MQWALRGTICVSSGSDLCCREVVSACSVSGMHVLIQSRDEATLVHEHLAVCAVRRAHVVRVVLTCVRAQNLRGLVGLELTVFDGGSRAPVGCLVMQSSERCQGGFRALRRVKMRHHVAIVVAIPLASDATTTSNLRAEVARLQVRRRRSGCWSSSPYGG